MSRNYKKYLVYGVTKERGFAFLENLIGEMKYKEIKQVKRNSHDFLVELANGDIYQVVSASQNSRGHKCDKAYVDRSVDLEILNCVIKPAILHSEADEQIIYF